MANSYRNQERFFGESGYLIHFGIKGQKWGVRRFQNEDGTLTEEGRLRYLGVTKDNYRNVEKIYNEAAGRTNKDLARINKKYNKVDLSKDDRANLEYSREVRDAWQKNYRDVLAKDIGTDPSTIVGQKWLDDVYGYKSNMDTEIEELEKKVKASEKKEKQKKSGISKAHESDDIPYSDNGIDPSTEKYGRTKMSSEKAFEILNNDLEKMYGEKFWDWPVEKQDKLMIKYVNESGLYRWM